MSQVVYKSEFSTDASANQQSLNDYRAALEACARTIAQQTAAAKQQYVQQQIAFHESKLLSLKAKQ